MLTTSPSDLQASHYTVYRTPHYHDILIIVFNPRDIC